MNKIVIVAVIVALVVGVLSFFGGMQYAKSKNSGGNGRGNLAGGFGQGNRPGANRGSFRPVAGDVIASDAKSITVKLADGSSKIVFLGSNTEINKAASASASDLKVGEKVAVFGMDNSDGSVAAASIQLNPMMRMMGSRSGTNTEGK